MNPDAIDPGDGADLDEDVIWAVSGVDALAERLAEAVADAARLARSIEEHWPDGRGQELAERVGTAAREIDRAAATAGELARGIGDRLVPLPAPHPTPPDGRTPGVRLPGLEGSRTSDERGVALPRLPEP